MKYAIAHTDSYYQIAHTDSYYQISDSMVESAKVQNAVTVLIRLTTPMNYTFDVSGETPEADDFVLNVNGTPATLSTFLVNRTYGSYALQVTISSYILSGQTVTFTYSGTTWKFANGESVPQLTDYPVTNDL